MVFYIHIVYQNRPFGNARGEIAERAAASRRRMHPNGRKEYFFIQGLTIPSALCYNAARFQK